MKATCSRFEAALDGAEVHNERLKELDYIRKDLSHLNETWKAPGFVSIKESKKEVADRYMAAHGKKLPKNATPIQETVVVIQADTTMEQLQNLARMTEEIWGYRPLAIYMHKDEGHEKAMKHGKYIPNLHAHMIFDTANSRGETLKPLSESKRRAQRTKWEKKEAEKAAKEGREPRPFREPDSWKKPPFDYMQNLAAEALGMERGIPSSKKHLDAITFKIQAQGKQLEELNQEIGKAQTRIKGLTTMIRHLEDDILNNEAEIHELQDKMEKCKEENAVEREELRKELERLSNVHSELETKIQDKKEKLSRAETVLDEKLKQNRILNDVNQKLRREKAELETLEAPLSRFLRRPDVAKAWELHRRLEDHAKGAFTEAVGSIRNFAERRSADFNDVERQSIATALISKCRIESWEPNEENLKKAGEFLYSEWEPGSTASEWWNHVVNLRIGQLASELFLQIGQSYGASGGGGGSNITDLTDWSGRKKR